VRNNRTRARSVDIKVPTSKPCPIKEEKGFDEKIELKSDESPTASPPQLIQLRYKVTLPCFNFAILQTSKTSNTARDARILLLNCSIEPFKKKSGNKNASARKI
jgi:hypothetical protein